MASLVLYFAIKESTWELLDSPDAPPSIPLLKRFLEACNNDEENIRKRLKCIPRIVNPDEMQINFATKRLVTTYNAKPFMTGPRCHTFYRGENYLEVDVDVHRFCYLARKAGYSMMDELGRMVLDLGLVVEGHSDEELPEQILGCVRVARLQRETAKPLQYWMQRASRSSSAGADASPAPAAPVPAT